MEPHKPEGLPRSPFDLLFIISENFKSKGDILEDGQVGEELEILKNHPYPPPKDRDSLPIDLGDIDPVYKNLAMGGLFLGKEELEQGGLASPARACEEDEPAPFDLDVNIGKRRVAA